MRKKRNKEELPAVDIVFTAREQAILNGEPAELWKLYLIISRLRDFETNIAGLRTRISDRTFKEQMEVTTSSGRQSKKLTTTHYRRLLKKLELLGLIENRGNYIFYLPLAYKKNPSKGGVTSFVTTGVTTGVTKNEHEESQLQQGFNSNIEIEVSPVLSPQVSPQVVYTSEEDFRRRSSEDLDLLFTGVNLEIWDPINIVDLKKNKSTRSDEVQRIFDFWKVTMSHEKAKLDDKRKRLITTALKLGYSESDLCDAISGCAMTPHNMGKNDRGERYDGLDLIFRNADKIDRFINNFKNPPETKNATSITSNRQVSNTESFYTECFDAIRNADTTAD